MVLVVPSITKKQQQTITLQRFSLQNASYLEIVGIFQDPVLHHGWRTGAIIPELEVLTTTSHT